MCSCGPLHIDEQRLDNQLEPIYNSSANTGCNLKDLPRVMGGQRGSEICKQHDMMMVTYSMEYFKNKRKEPI